jgi:FAD/FMN-containing dehydrogenase
MTTLLALVAALDKHRADPNHPDLIQELHELAAQVPHLAHEMIETALPALPRTPSDVVAIVITHGREILDPILPDACEAPPAVNAPAPSSPPPGMPPQLTPPVTNWGTNVRLDMAEGACQPVSTGQAQNVLELVARSHRKAKPIGAAHSSSPIVQTRGLLMDTGALIAPGTSASTSTIRQCRELVPGFYKLNDAERALHVEVGSGVQVKDVNAYLAASGRALRMTGAYTGQTLVGAFCTSTHGAGIQHPPLHASVRSIQLLSVSSSGEVEELRVEPSKGITDPEAYARGYPRVRLIQDVAWFYAVLVAMGSMGLITSVILEATTAFSLRREDWRGKWDACKALLLDVGPSVYPRFFEGSYSAGLSFNPYAIPLWSHGKQAVTLSRYFVADAPPARYKPPSQSGLNPLLVLGGQVVGNDLPALTPFMIDRALGGDPTTPTWGPSYQVLGSPDNLPPGYSAEYAFPLDRYMDAVEAILARMTELAMKRVQYMVGPVTLRWVGKDSAFLSMSEGSDRVYAEFLSLAQAGRGQEVLAAIEPIALQYGGRPHWGQWFSLDAVPTILSLYPRYGEWKEIYQRLNASGVFSNDFTDRLP